MSLSTPQACASAEKSGRTLEKYSVLRAVSAIERADVVLFLIDGEKGIRDQDKHVAGLAHDEGKGVIIVYNKWDTVEKDERTMNEISEKDPRRVQVSFLRADCVCLRDKPEPASIRCSR